MEKQILTSPWGEIRVYHTEGRSLFDFGDVCRALEIKDQHDVYTRIARTSKTRQVEGRAAVNYNDAERAANFAERRRSLDFIMWMRNIKDVVRMYAKTLARKEPTIIKEEKPVEMTAEMTVANNNTLQSFVSEKFGNIRGLSIDGEPWFVGKDVTDALGYKNGSRDVNTHVDDEDKLKYQISTAGQMREQLLINESGLYSLILSSKLPEAKGFKRWVTSEVVPAIRKTGGYIMNEKNLSDDELIDRAFRALNRKLKEREKELDALKDRMALDAPKVAFAETVANVGNDITINELAKLAFSDETQMGRTKMFKWLRKNGYIMEGLSLPYQRHINAGLFKVREKVTRQAAYPYCLVTPKGQVKILAEYKANPRIN